MWNTKFFPFIYLVGFYLYRFTLMVLRYAHAAGKNNALFMLFLQFQFDENSPAHY